jgi:hypothetical protein
LDPSRVAGPNDAAGLCASRGPVSLTASAVVRLIVETSISYQKEVGEYQDHNMDVLYLGEDILQYITAWVVFE